MGEAKRRGTKQQRRENALRIQMQDELRRRALYAQALEDADRGVVRPGRSIHRRPKLNAMILAVAAGIGSMILERRAR